MNRHIEIKIISYTWIFLMILLGSQVNGQDPQFSQFYANPLYLNPALAGSAKCARLSINYRNQWPGTEASFSTYSASYDQYFDAISGGVGLLITNDNAGNGTLNMFNASLVYAYRKSISKNLSISAGLQATYFQTSLNWEELTFTDMVDSRYGFIYETAETADQLTRSGVDFSAGAMIYSDRYFGGVAVTHLIEPKVGLASGSDQRLPRKYTIHTGAVLPIKNGFGDEIFKLSPNILYQQQGEFKQLNVGMYISKGPVVGGVWYRAGDSFIVLFGIHMKRFKIGYSFDFTVSDLSLQKTAGSHELSFTWNFKCPTKKRKFRTASCPTF